MSEIRLLPCPFCGGEAEFYRTPIKSKNGGWCDSVVVRCKKCEARTNRVLYDARKHQNDSEYNQAATAWNTRKPMKEIVERFQQRKDFYQNRMDEMSGTDRDVEDWGSVKSYLDAIDIVKEVGGMNG